MSGGCSHVAKKTAARVSGPPVTPAPTSAVSGTSASRISGDHCPPAAASITPVAQHDKQPPALDSHDSTSSSAVTRFSNPSKTTEPRRRGRAKKAPVTRQSKRQRGVLAPSVHGGSIKDNPRVPSISTGRRNPGSETSQYSLINRQARDARRQADTHHHYEGLVSVRLENQEVVLGKYSGGWKFQCSAPECSGPALLFQFVDRWISGFIHGEGTFEFTCTPPHRIFRGMRDGDVYKGTWVNNLPHGQGLYSWLPGSSYEGTFLKGEMTGKGTLRNGFEHNAETDGHHQREYVGDFQDGFFHGHGTLKFSLYVDQDLRSVDEQDQWDVYTGYFRYGKMDGSGKLTYNHSPFMWFADLDVDDRPCPSDFAPPGGVGFRRRCSSYPSGFAYYFDEDSPILSQVHIYGKTGDVYVGEFRENLFHGSGVYQFKDPDTGRTAGYTAIWESGKRVGGEPKLWLQSKMGVWEKVGGN